MMLVDTHCHLTMLEHDSVESILKRAEEAGVKKMVTVSTAPDNWAGNQTLAQNYNHVYYTLGLHPHEAKDWKSCEATLKDFFKEENPAKCVAIGEMGLDYYYEHSDRKVQIEACEAQIHLAKQCKLPIVVHCREAFADFFEIIKRTGLPEAGGVMHCFTGTKAEAKQSLDFGFKISFSGIVSFKKSEDLRSAAKIVPLEHLLIETDCPFLAPVPHRGKPNEPSFLPFTAEVLASTLGIAVEELAQRSTQNAVNFFKLETSA